MTGSNRRANAGRKAQKPKSQPSQSNRTTRKAQLQRVDASRISAPLMQSNSNHRQMRNEVTTLRGSDFLGFVSVLGSLTTAGERIRKTFPVSPSAYPGTRLAQLSNLWERFRFTRFSLRYVPSVPNTLACQMVLYQDTDPKDDPTTITDADALIQQATAQTGSQQWNFNSAKRVDLARRADKELYYTGVTKENVRFNYQGIAYLIQQSACINFNGEAVSDVLECGSIYVDWEVQFQTPQINPVVVAASSSPPQMVEDGTLDWVDTIVSPDTPGTIVVPAKPYDRVFNVSRFGLNSLTTDGEDLKIINQPGSGYAGDVCSLSGDQYGYDREFKELAVDASFRIPAGVIRTFDVLSENADTEYRVTFKFWKLGYLRNVYKAI